MSFGERLFRWRLLVIVGMFGVAGSYALLASRVDLGLSSFTQLFGLERMFLFTGPFCLVALLLRVSGEARLGAAVYGQDASKRVVSGGPFRFSRHPLYLGTWLFFVAACAPYLPPLVLGVLAVVFALALSQIGAHEERALAEAHGDAWTRYASVSPRFLGVPRGFVDDGLAPTPANYGSALAGNLFFLALGVYRVVVGTLGLEARGVRALGLVTLACLVAWLVIVAVRRLRASR